MRDTAADPLRSGSLSQALERAQASLPTLHKFGALRIDEIVRATAMKADRVLQFHGRVAELMRDIELVTRDKSGPTEAAFATVAEDESRLVLPVDRGIVRVSRRVSREMVARIAAGNLDLKIIDHRLFEELVAELFDGFGYEVELTARTRDGGRDVVAVKHAEVQVKYLIECKRPGSEKRVGVRPVRELLGVKSDEGASKAVLATTVSFTREARELERRQRWELELRDYKGVMEWVWDYLTNLREPTLPFSPKDH